MNRLLTAVVFSIAFAAGTAQAGIPLPPPPSEVIAKVKSDVHAVERKVHGVVTGKRHRHSAGNGHRYMATHSHRCAKRNSARRCVRWVHR